MKVTNLIIIDASSSMTSKAPEIRDGIKQIIKEIKKDMKKSPEVKTTTIVCQFSSSGTFTTLLNTSNQKKIRTNIVNNYKPKGLTALYDAIGTAFAKIPEKQDGVFINILTDGMENDSKEFKKGDVARLFEKAKADEWAVTFLGTTQEAIESARQLGVSNSNSFVFEDSKDGVKMSNNLRSNARTTYYNSVINGEEKQIENLIKD